VLDYWLDIARIYRKEGQKVPKIKIYDSQSSEYHQVFQFFLDHTDEKEKTIQWLKQVVEGLPSRQLFIDAGAGDGGMTAWLSDWFQHTIALEPNEVLRAKLKKNCPQIEVWPEMILQATLPAREASFVLCSHVFYYVHHEAWMANLERLVSWLASDGVLVVALQHHESDCLKMHQHFCGPEFNLTALAEGFQRNYADQYEVTIETIPINIVTQDLNSAYIIAEFMLNLLPITNLPTRHSVEAYIRKHFHTEKGRYSFSTDQTLLQIRTQT